MRLHLKKSGDFVVMQASGSPAEIAEFITAANLVEVPIVLDESEDALAEMDISVVVAQ